MKKEYNLNQKNNYKKILKIMINLKHLHREKLVN